MEIVRRQARPERFDKDLLYVFGGAALIIAGAGLILASPPVRRRIGRINLKAVVERVLPDLERYLQIRAM